MIWVKLSASLLGLITLVLLFPIGGTTQCTEYETGGECISWSDSILMRYEGDNGTVGMGVALAAAVLVWLVVYFVGRSLYKPAGETSDPAISSPKSPEEPS